jgi:hypothetical protein
MSTEKIPPTTCTHPTLPSEYNLQYAGIFYSLPNTANPLTHAPPHRKHYHYHPHPCNLAHGRTTFVYPYESKKELNPSRGCCYTPLIPHESTHSRQLHSPNTHTNNRAKLAAIDLGLKFGHTALLTDSACSLRLIRKYIRCPNSMCQHLHRDVLPSIVSTLQSHSPAGIITYLGKL